MSQVDGIEVEAYTPQTQVDLKIVKAKRGEGREQGHTQNVFYDADEASD